MNTINNLGTIGIANQVKKVGRTYHDAVLSSLNILIKKYIVELSKYLFYKKYSGCIIKNGDIIINDIDMRKNMQEKIINNLQPKVENKIYIYIQSFNQSEKSNVKILSDILAILQKIKYRKNDDEMDENYSNLNNLINKLSF